MPPRTWSRSSAAALVTAVVLLAACPAASAPVRSLDPNADVVVRYAVAGGGEVRFTVHPRYMTSQPVAVDLDLIAGAIALGGPVSESVVA